MHRGESQRKCHNCDILTVVIGIFGTYIRFYADYIVDMNSIINLFQIKLQSIVIKNLILIAPVADS